MCLRQCLVVAVMLCVSQGNVCAQSATPPCNVDSQCTAGLQTACCGPYGCCTPTAKKFYVDMFSGITGQCKSDLSTTYTACTRSAIACINSGVDMSSPVCSNMLTTCFMCSAPSKTTVCSLSVSMLFGPSQPLAGRPCLPNTCIASRQAEQFSKNLYKALCVVMEKFSVICTISTLNLQCPGVTVTCTSSTQCSASYSATGRPHTGQVTHINTRTPPTVSPATTAPAAPCKVGGATRVVDCAVTGRANGSTACCAVQGQALGCCTPDVAAFLNDLFRGISQVCANDLVKDQRPCITKAAACLVKAQEAVQSGTFSKGSLTTLDECNLMTECSVAVSGTQTCSISDEILCSSHSQLIKPYSVIGRFPGITTDSKLCVPSSCGSPSGLNAISKLFYTALCFPLCQLSGAGSGPLSLSSCPISSTSLTCPNSNTGMYTNPNNVCSAYRLNFTRTATPSSVPATQPVGPGTGSGSWRSHAGTAPSAPSSQTGQGQGGSAVPSTPAQKSSSMPTVQIVIIVICCALFAVLVTIGVIFVAKRRQSGPPSIVAYSGLDDDDSYDHA